MGKKRTEEEKEYWRNLWLKALENMPSKMVIIEEELYVNYPTGTIPLMLYTPLHAKGNIKLEKNFHVRRIVQRRRSCYGKRPLLFLMLGELDMFSKQRLNKAIKSGIRPTKEVRRQRLISLAENGRQIAWDYLHLVGKDHLYTDDESQWCESVLNPGKHKRFSRR